MVAKFSTQRSLFSSELVLMSSSLLVNVGNYGFNVIAGRLLSPAAFGEVSILITLLLGLSFLATAFQLTATRFTTAAAYLTTLAWRTGIVLLLIVMASASFISTFFSLSSSQPIAILALSIPIYFMMSVGRGLLQGNQYYGLLAATYQAEVWVRLVMGLGFIMLGFANTGIAISLLGSLIAAFLIIRKLAVPASPATASMDRKPVLMFFVTTLCYELSQLLINHSDLFLVKHYFTTQDAGLYAGLALIGRVVYFSTWSVVMVLFPKIIDAHRAGKPVNTLFLQSLCLVSLLAGGVLVACWLFPEWIVSGLLGSAYTQVAQYLWQYALATTFFALTNVFVYYHLSFGRRVPVLLTAAGGCLQIVLILKWHHHFQEVVIAQIVAMASLLISLSIYHVTRALLPGASIG